ncbi:type I-B CRISPR-associated protein Cas7/Csh2 [candidate division NPL-UPA2 bacterium]|nr:type I-B CRISPR-associated protein Cas7/Csh2 [candidate division NPL-UPA2 bacterium]
MSKITNKSELLFLYDIKDANPNGDPLDENKPRIDEETGINIVTDVRLKRTIRDYLFDYKGYNGTEGRDIFVREIKDEDDYVQDAKLRAKDFLVQSGKAKDEFKKMKFSEQRKIIAQNLLNECIDVRLFGGTVPLELDVPKKTEPEKGSVTYTGPVQFKMGRSLHPVATKHIKGTGAFADQYTEKAKKKHATFREEDVLHYSLIAFCGIINPAAANHTRLKEEDVSLLLEGIWEGTKNLISRSKFGQMPRLLLKINYTNPTYFIGDLDRYIKIESDLSPEKIRDISQFRLDVTGLHQILSTNRDKIESCQYLRDERLKLICNKEEASLEGILEGLNSNRIKF